MTSNRVSEQEEEGRSSNVQAERETAIEELSRLIGTLDGIAYNDFVDYARRITLNNAPGSSSGSRTNSNKTELAIDQFDIETLKLMISKAKELPKASPQPPQGEDSPIPRKKARVPDTTLEKLLNLGFQKAECLKAIRKYGEENVEEITNNLLDDQDKRGRRA